MYILLTTYIIGLLLAYAMQRTEMAAELDELTKGTRALIISLSLLSFVFVIIMLIRGWVKMVGITGYWRRPAKEKALVTEKTNS